MGAHASTNICADITSVLLDIDDNVEIEMTLLGGGFGVDPVSILWWKHC